MGRVDNGVALSTDSAHGRYEARGSRKVARPSLVENRYASFPLYGPMKDVETLKGMPLMPALPTP
ncbi:hypothetical protein [Azomonas macrocytogenes]|uniref:Uncharacterized protein n=1 Tax=Azomonas macrocytogenes TaxID=69962 RepID=A0A839SYD6_AZOMA|nr:hypothetical protein [Azomonas macrocytogenes]MBB3102132.1 hypothetical protein [Azomonas macrocytogenes]